MLVSLNARIVSEEEAKIPATDPAALYGLGVFEVLRAYRGRPFRLSDHLARMGRSARRFGLNRRSIPPSIEEQIRDRYGSYMAGVGTDISVAQKETSPYHYWNVHEGDDVQGYQ